MAESPQTIVELMTLPCVDTSYKNVLDIEPNNVNSFYSYYVNMVQYDANNIFYDCQYIRRDKYVELPIIFDKALQFNYLRYDNGEGLGYEYAFITNHEFVNFSMTRFYLQYDSWTNNINHINSFNEVVFYERQHRNYRNLDVGHEDIMYEGKPYNRYNFFGNSYEYIVLFVNLEQVAFDVTYTPSLISSGVGCVMVKKSSLTTAKLNKLISESFIYNANGIVLSTASFSNQQAANMTSDISGESYPVIINPIACFNNYTETFTEEISLTYNDLDSKDGKIYVYPYTYIKINDGCREWIVDYKYLPKSNNTTYTYTFTRKIEPIFQGFVITYTDNQQNKNIYTSTLTSRVLTTKSYLEQYWTENSSQFTTSSILASLTTIGSTAFAIATGNPLALVGAVGGVVTNIKNFSQIADLRDKGHSVSPATYDEYFQNVDGKCYRVYRYALPQPQENTCISTWDRTGYLLNVEGEFNFKTRELYTYTKTIDINVITIPENECREKVNAIFNAGVTCWHQSSVPFANLFGNYVGNYINRSIE